MTWNAEATIQFIGVLISILGIGIACYNNQSITTASRKLCGMLFCRDPCSQTNKTNLM